MVKITGVIPDSIAEIYGIKSGDELLSVNKNEINDVLDYRFFCTDKKLKLELLRDGKRKKVKIKKDENDDLGLEFAT